MTVDLMHFNCITGAISDNAYNHEIYELFNNEDHDEDGQPNGTVYTSSSSLIIIIIIIATIVIIINHYHHHDSDHHHHHLFLQSLSSKL